MQSDKPTPPAEPAVLIDGTWLPATLHQARPPAVAVPCPGGGGIWQLLPPCWVLHCRPPHRLPGIVGHTFTYWNGRQFQLIRPVKLPADYWEVELIDGATYAPAPAGPAGPAATPPARWR